MRQEFSDVISKVRESFIPPRANFDRGGAEPFDTLNVALLTRQTPQDNVGLLFHFCACLVCPGPLTQMLKTLEKNVYIYIYFGLHTESVKRQLTPTEPFHHMNTLVSTKKETARAHRLLNECVDSGYMRRITIARSHILPAA